MTMCKECDEEEVWSIGGRYHSDTFSAAYKDYCFTCAFWLERLAKEMVDGVVIAQSVFGNATSTYFYAYNPKEPMVRDRARSPLGFGGRVWDILFTDGRMVTTNNLWSGGEIPERFHDRFPINATIVNQPVKQYTDQKGPYDPDAILEDPNAHPTHKLYAEINIGIRDRGESWSKCMNCGEPYQVNGDQSYTFCSSSCEAEYRSDPL